MGLTAPLPTIAKGLVAPVPATPIGTIGLNTVFPAIASGLAEPAPTMTPGLATMNGLAAPEPPKFGGGCIVGMSAISSTGMPTHSELLAAINECGC
jgi:hypothetical protein